MVGVALVLKMYPLLGLIEGVWLEAWLDVGQNLLKNQQLQRKHGGRKLKLKLQPYRVCLKGFSLDLYT